MLNKEQINAMMADEEILMQEAEEVGARCVESLKHISAEDVEAHTRMVMERLGISEAFLSGESCSESLSDFLNAEYRGQTDFFDKQKLEAARENMRQRQLEGAKRLNKIITNTMRGMSSVHVGRKGVIVRTLWPEVQVFAFRSLRTAKVWNKKRIRKIREDHE